MNFSFARYLLLAALYLSACSPAAVAPTVTVTSAPEPTATAVQPTAVPATAEAERALQSGQWTYLFYHEGLGQVMLVNGGPERGKPAEDPLELWAWDGTRWSLILADGEGPSWRNWAAAAYDPVRDVLVIHGGLQDGRNFDETWEWDGRSWTRFDNTGPGAREGALMAYDAARESILLYGGSTPDFSIHGDTWLWDGQSWSQVSDTGPAPRFPGGMVYDPAREEILLYSGHFAASTGEFTNYDDLWAWDGSAWHEKSVTGPTPGHRTHSGLVFDPLTEQVLLVSSGIDTFLSDVWAWDGSRWTEIPATGTPARSGPNVAYDPARDRFVLFGGVDRPGGTALTDTWEWDRTTWTCVDGC